MQDPFRLHNEIALITGGGTGLGLGMARCFVKSGARVILVGRREAELSKAAASLGSSAHYIVHDVTAFDQTGELIRKADRAFGAPVTILANNAGINMKRPAVQTTTQELNDILQTNVVAAHALAAAALPGMIQRKHGNILFTASMASLFGIPGLLAYSAAKSAYLGMVRTMAVEVSQHNVRVNAIAPGWIESAMSRRALQDDPAREQRILSRTPMQRLGEADDIGWAAVYLCSPAAKFVTGVVLPVDGGISIGF
jgi:gluconate 5-dehydrogenase